MNSCSLKRLLGCNSGTTLLAVLVRRATGADHQPIFAVHDAAFTTGDGSVAIEATLVDDLRAAGDVIDALSLVVEVDGQVVGHVLGSRARIDEHPSLGIGPLGVAPSHQQCGVGSALVHAVLAAADALGSPEAILLGDPAYYRRFGFRSARELGVTPPDPAWHEHFQIRTLARWNSSRTGTFHYAPAFGGT